MRAEGVDLTGLNRKTPGHSWAGLGGEIIDFRYRILLDSGFDRIGIGEIAVTKLYPAIQLGQLWIARNRRRTAESNQSIIFLQKQFGQQEPILTANAENHRRSFHVTRFQFVSLRFYEASICSRRCIRLRCRRSQRVFKLNYASLPHSTFTLALEK